MKKLLLASTACLPLVIPYRAQAQIGPGTIVFDPTQASHMLQELGFSTEIADSTAQTLQQAIQTVQWLNQLYSLTQQVEGDLDHLTNANSLATELNLLRNSMPPTGVLPIAITGNGGFGGDGDGWASQFYNQNVVYQPTQNGATDWVAQRMQIDAQWLANVQGQGAQNLSNLEQRATGLADLQGCVDNSQTIQDESGCNSRVATENAYAINQSAQATNLLVLSNAQHDAAIQAQQQANRQHLDLADLALCSTLSGLGTADVATSCTSAGGTGDGTTTTASPDTFLIPGTDTPIASNGG